MKPLKLGIAYHGNRLINHTREDLIDIVKHNFNTVVHMFSHNDMVRGKTAVKDVFQMTLDMGLELWVDNWGIGGTPGDPSHFLCYHPEAHQYTSDGEVRPINVCFNHESFVSFTKEWIDTVYDYGGRKIFWDEPSLISADDKFSCACPLCQKLFEERYGRKMPSTPDKDTVDFQMWTVRNYFETVTAYARAKGMENIVCVMPGKKHGICLETAGVLGELETIDNIGTDPYWVGGPTGADVYKYVYESTKKCLDVCETYKKDHNLWIQGYGERRGFEEDVVYAAQAAYDAGARNIFVWGFRGCEANWYRAARPELSWRCVGDAMQRVLDSERDRVIGEARKLVK